MGEMHEKSDAELLRAYAEHGQETAFRELVARYTDLVYSAAIRQVESNDLAADIAQNIFVDLARKARPIGEGLTGHKSLAGWLHRSTRFLALNHLRDTHRRVTNERQAMEQLLTNSESSVDWEQIRPTLDEALDSLGDDDREALLLRYFKNHDFRNVGLTLGISDDTAQKRVSRAVERLREFFAKRGVTVGANGLAVVISANAVQAAPVGLALTISTAAALTGTTLATTATVIATKAIAMTALQKVKITATVAIMAGAGIYEARQAVQLREQVQTLQQQQAPLTEQNQNLQRERAEMARQLGLLRSDNERLNSNTIELLKLRGEVGQLRKLLSDSKQSLPALGGQKSEGSPAATETEPPAVIPKETWAFSGYGTPEAALQTVAWAMNRGDVKAFLASLTPESQQLMQQQFSGKSQSELEANLREEISGIGALRPDWKRDSSPNEVSFVLLTKQEDNGATKVKDDAVLRFKNIGGEWKCAF